MPITKKTVLNSILVPMSRKNGSISQVSDEILRKCRTTLENLYGLRFRGLVLYGSMARGQGTPVSDIDLLVLLNQPFDYFCELRRIVDALYPIQLESEQLISAKPAGLDDYERGRIQLFRNAKREGKFV